MRVNKTIVLSMLFCLAFLYQGYCQDASDKQDTGIIRGQIAYMDWVAGKIVIRTTDSDKPDEITIVVPDDLQIAKGTETITPAELIVSDNVTVEYSNYFAGLKATRISVTE